MKFGNLVELCLWPHLAVKGLTVFEFNYLEARHHSGADGGFCDGGGLEIQYTVAIESFRF